MGRRKTIPNKTEKLKEIASKHNCWILEDACHAPGGFFQDSNSKNIKAEVLNAQHQLAN